MSRNLIALIAFLVVAFGLAYLIDFVALIPALERKEVAEVLLLGVARMYAPFVGVLAALKIMGRSVKEGLAGYGLRIGVLEYVVLGILVPYAIYAISVALGMIMGFEILNPIKSLRISLPRASSVGSGLLLILVIVSSVFSGSTINTLAALGEEMGWRGFLLSELGSRLGLYPASIVIGVVWGLWHAPLILLAGYDYPHHPDLLGLSMFIAVCTVWSVILCQLRVLGRSILPPSFMHGNINAIARVVLATFRGDEIYTAPLGLLGIASSTIIAVAIAILARNKLCENLAC